MPGHAVRNDLALCQFDRGKQSGRPVAFVVVRERLQSTGKQPQAFLRSVERLNLALLVAREDQRMFRRIEIQPNNVHQFLGKLGVVGRLESFGQMASGHCHATRD